MYNFNANPIARHPRTAQSPRLGRVLLRQIVVPGDSPLNLFRTIALAHSPAGRESQRKRQRQCRAMQTSVTIGEEQESCVLLGVTQAGVGTRLILQFPVYNYASARSGGRWCRVQGGPCSRWSAVDADLAEARGCKWARTALWLGPSAKGGEGHQ